MAIKRNSGQTNANRSFAAAETVTANVVTAGSGGTTISSITVTDSSYVPKTPATSYISTTGNYVTILGTGFTSASQLYIQGSLVTSTTYVSNTQINAQIPAYNTSSVTTQQIFVANTATNAAGILITGFGYGVIPYWTISTSLTGSTPNASVSLSAVSASTLTYSVISGTLPSGLSLNTSTGLLSGTISTGTSTSFVVQAVNPQNQSNTQTFSITILAADPYFYETTLLLNGENTTTTYIADASTNTFALSVVGAATPNRYNPLWGTGYYSNYFASSSIQLAYNTTPLFAQGTAYTIEAWVHITAAGTANTYAGANPIACTAVNSASTGNGHYWGFGPTAFVWENRAGNAYPTISYTAPLNQWFHFAFTTADGQNFTLYINGTSVGTYNDTSGAYYADSTYNFYVGAGNGTGVNANIGTYVSNLRYTKAQVYTGNFTVPTVPLTATQSAGTNISAITTGQCTILTCQNANFINNSILSSAITVISGTPKVTSNQPFNTLASNITVNTGYSTYFNGSTDSLTLSDNAAFQMGTGDFTIECWVCPTALSATDARIWSYQNSGSSTVMNVYLLATGSSSVFSGEIRSSTGVSDSQQNGTTTAVVGTWYHVAYVRASGNTRLFVNGVQEGTTVTSQTQNIASGVPGIGAYPGFSNYFAGYISNFRILKGTGLYTANFTPSSSPLTSIANTSLLTCQGSQIADSSTNAFVITSNGSPKVLNNTYPFTQTTTTVTSITSFGSGFFDGSTGYLITPGGINYSTSNFTVEGWINVSSVALSSMRLIQYQNGSASNSNYAWYILINTGTVQGYVVNGTTITGPASNLVAQNLSINTWHHFAVVRNGTSLQTFVDGIGGTVITIPASINNPSGALHYIGSDYTTTINYSGYISNLRILYGTALYTSNFAPPVAPLTPVANTALLTLQNKQGNTNKVFYDDSVNNFALAIYSSPTQGTFSPFSPTGWSVYFGTTTQDAITFPSASQYAISGNFTLECWWYPTASPSQSRIFIQGQAGTTALSLEYNSGVLSSTINTTQVLSYSFSSSLNNWYHLALVRNGTGSNNLVLYVNGVSVATATNNVAIGQYQAIVGGLTWATGYDVNGYVSNLRYNNTALYTGAFTPGFSPLTAVSGTLILTCQSNRFIDNSSYAVTPTITNTPVIQAFSPFPPGVAYSPTTHSGSIYLDGASYLNTVATSGNITLLAGDFSMETYVYFTTIQPSSDDGFGGPSIYSLCNGGNASTIVTYWVLGLGRSAKNAGPDQFSFSYNLTGATAGNTGIVSSGVTPVANQWYHMAVTRAGTTLRLFVNGVLLATGSASGTIGNASYTPYVGVMNYTYGRYLNGYVSNLRMVNGSIPTAYQTISTTIGASIFTPPTAPLVPTLATSLLLLGTNGGIVDQGSRVNLTTVGSAKTGNSIYKYGTGSLAFNGTTDYLSTPYSTLYALESIDFTIEAWVYRNSSGAEQTIANTRSASLSDGWGFRILAANTLNFYYTGGGTVTSTATIPTTTWTHVAATRVGTLVRLFINGVFDTSGTATAANASTSPLRIGVDNSNASGWFNGYIDDLRITRGYARYSTSTNFTPPISQFLTL